MGKDSCERFSSFSTDKNFVIIFICLGLIGKRFICFVLSNIWDFNLLIKKLGKILPHRQKLATRRQMFSKYLGSHLDRKGHKL
jgi:hypothetical protein